MNFGDKFETCLYKFLMWPFWYCTSEKSLPSWNYWLFTQPWYSFWCLPQNFLQITLRMKLCSSNGRFMTYKVSCRKSSAGAEISLEDSPGEIKSLCCFSLLAFTEIPLLGGLTLSAPIFLTAKQIWILQHVNITTFVIVFNPQKDKGEHPRPIY